MKRRTFVKGVAALTAIASLKPWEALSMTTPEPEWRMWRLLGPKLPWDFVYRLPLQPANLFLTEQELEQAEIYMLHPNGSWTYLYEEVKNKNRWEVEILPRAVGCYVRVNQGRMAVAERITPFHFKCYQALNHRLIMKRIEEQKAIATRGTQIQTNPVTETIWSFDPGFNGAIV